ncbi:PAS domain S-box protein [Nostoc sp. 'Lobaria pulmonaria (5183) cyanobiont']|uniref:PAS domain S-box protein n=1 Tax=Nostoc sp. 'Lobaria pulmonaria (5183) cyanobiont' TaxID=1618022 RepID=UPI000CF33888|nr:PAS domain S-box protein [Nostoc sp. 'Lobaria pulmonaria (5183) cyanobiont']AVH70584.1 histidine kinase [Nostoc sp. 'Lobaria pulmonaria (5183) cyanobiont']
MPHIHYSQLLRYGIVVLIVALALVLMLVLDPWLSMSETPFLLFFSTVMLSAWYGGLKSGLLATSLSALLSAYFFLPPAYELSLDLSNFVRIGLFALQGLLFSFLCEGLKTAKRRADGNLQKLRVSEERFRLALSSSDIVVFQQDRDLRYQWIHNPQGLDTTEEILGKSDDELFPALVAEQLKAIKLKVIETDVATRQEVYLTIGGENRYYDLLVEPLKDADNSILGITCAGVNITERRQAELEKARLHQELQQAIQQKDESLALINAWLTSSPVALAFLDPELRYIHANETLAAINGVPQTQHIGRTFREVLPEWAAQIEPVFEQVMETRQPLLNQEVSGETYPPGVYRYGLVSYYPVCLPNGQLLGVGISSIDITQLKQTEQALRESEAKFRSVVESNMIGIGFWDRDGRITDANDALLNMVGYTREELLANTLRWQDLTPTEYLPLDKQALTQFQDSLFCTPYQKEYIRKDGSRLPVLAGGSHFEGTIDRGAFFVLDITERKQAEERLRYIAQISSLLSTSLDYEQTLQQIAKISVPQLADWCSVDILNEDGSIRRLPIAHADPSKAELARKLQEYVTDYKGASAITRVLQTGQSELISEVSDSLLIATTQNQEHLELVRQLGMKSVMIVPLIAKGRILGCITFINTLSDRRYDRTDLTLATDITHRAALAVENAQLYRDIHQALLHYAESLSLLDALLGAAPVAVCFFDRELRYIRINQVFADINGLAIEEHLGRKFREVLPAMAAELEPQLQRVLETGEPLLNMEISGETRGQLRRYGYWLGNYYPVNNAIGETVGIGIILADVTIAKQTEVALRESEERFRAMFNQAAVGITLVGLDGRFLQVNPALCEITGYTYEELIQMNFQEITHPDDLEVDWENAQRVLAKEISGYSLEKRYIRKDGSIVWANLTSSAVWDANGQPKYALGIIEDISHRKRVEATQNFLVEASTLLAASLDYEITLENVANLAVPTLADLCIVDVFQEDWSSKQIAIAIADPTKLNILDEIRRRYRPQTRAKQLVQQLRLGISVFYPELSDSHLLQMSEDNEHRQLLQSLGIRSLMVIPVRSRGQLFGAISFFTAESGRYYQQTDLALAEDIARRAATAIDNARLYQETQRSVNRTVLLQKITAAFSEALTPQQVADVVVNQGIAALEATGGSVVLLTEGNTTLKVVQAIGYPQTLINTWTSFPIAAPNQIAETVRTGQPIFLENLAAMIARYPDLADVVTVIANNAWASIPLIVEGKVIGALGLSFTTGQIFNEEDRGFMLTLGQQCAQAIARAQLYEAEKIARAEAETANRIKDEFLAVLSHELRTPLNPILGWAKLLRTRKFNEATRIQALETIERNAKLQTQLIGDLLDVSRILQGKVRLNLHAVDLKIAIASALETVRLAAEAKSIQIQTVLNNDIGKVLGDGDRLQQVMWNLLSNAVKFTPTEGLVEVRLEQVGLDAQIQVIDTGKGINPEFLPYVFDYFRQADAKTTRVFGGLGLGLAIVRHLVELHGGTVQAESLGEGQGATFTVKLPLLKNSELRVSSGKAPQPEVSNDDTLLAGVQILLVDDQADVREFFSFALEQYGATVTAVESADEALQTLVQSKPDILLSDIGMPLMDGYMLLGEVRKLPPEQGGQIPAIALTAYAGELNYNQAMAAGFQKHLPKPVDPVDLAAAIVSLIGHT